MYCLHGTSIENTISILKDGYIIPSKNLTMFVDESTNQTFAQIIYRGICNQANQKPHWGNICFILKKDILKDLPFYATKIGGFSNTFEEGIKNKSKHLAYGSGDLLIMPKLRKLKEHIFDYMDKEGENIVGFIHSHEILFNKNININKYCLGIIIYIHSQDIYKKNKKDIKNIEKLSKKYNLFIKYEIAKNKFSGYGLNNFIDLIESN